MNARLQLNEMGRGQLERLWRAVHGREAPASALALFDKMVPRGVDWSGWPSHVSDDHTPYEFSLVLGRDAAELRVLAEVPPERGPITLESTIRAGQSFCAWLEREHGTDVRRLRAVEDLFFSNNPVGTFAFWHAAVFEPTGRDTSFKIYLNPQACGKEHAPRIVEGMLECLGFRDAWPTLSAAARRGSELDEIRYVSLDLSGRASARVKVYLFHHDATFGDLQHVASFADGHEPERLDRFLETVTGGRGLLRASRQVGTCLSFVMGKALPRTTTVHVPIRAYAGNDADARERILRAAAALGIPMGPYERAVDALANRPLDMGSGLHAWVSLRLGATDPRMSVYLAPEALATAPVHTAVFPMAEPESPTMLLKRYEDIPITSTHPFLVRMARVPFDLSRVYLLLLNIQVAITTHFTRRLASVIARVEEDDIRSILAKQLNDELGNGNPERTHKILFERFVEGLRPYSTVAVEETMLRAGRELSLLLERIYTQCDAYEGVGAALMMEVYGRQVDQFLGGLFRRGSNLPAPILEWLTMHETLEDDHVAESFELVNRIPEGWKRSAAARGIKRVADAGRAFFDAMYPVFFQ